MHRQLEKSAALCLPSPGIYNVFILLMSYTGDQVLDFQNPTLIVIQYPTLRDSLNRLTASMYRCPLTELKDLSESGISVSHLGFRKIRP
jgi:hypothetical protein